MDFPHTFLVLLFRLLYRLVSSGEDLYREYQIYHQVVHDVPHMPIVYLVLPLIIAVPNTLIHYFMGHVFPIIRILENERHPVNDNENPTPRRNWRETIQSLQASGGNETLFRGFPVGILYHLVLYTLTFILRVILPRAIFPTVLVEVGARVLLSELHLTWTHATITAHPTVPVPHHNNQRWKSLFFPALIHACAKSALHHQTTITQSAIAFCSFENFSHHKTTNREAHILATLEIAPLISCLLVQVFTLLPATIALTLVEASFLPKEEMTIIPDARGRRRARMGEFADGHIQLVKRIGKLQGVYRFVSGETFVDMCLLHLGKCLAQWTLESVVWEFGTLIAEA